VDESLLAAMASGDAAAAAAFVRRHQARVYGLALALAGDPALAEEVAQEAFLRARRDAAARDPGDQVSGWVLALTREAARDVLHRRPGRPLDPRPAMGRLVDGAATRAPGAPERDRLRVALGALPEEQSRMVVLSAIYGLSAAEGADVEGVPLGTARTRLRRGLARLRREVDPGPG
jgi:RNA polymerase sigma-70 factor (ECF subfamily)